MTQVPDHPNLFKHLGGQWTIGHAQILDIVDEIESASPRVTIIVGVAMIDDCLTEALRLWSVNQEKKFLERCFGEHGTIRDFSMKVDLGAAFGIFGLIGHHDLMKLRDMRNLAAHKSTKNDFNSAKIKGLCRDLKLPGKGMRRTPEPTAPRERFIYTVSLISDCLLASASLRRTEGVKYSRAILP